MELHSIKRYIGRKVFLYLKNGFKYKFFLKEEYIVGNTISFTGKFGEPIDITFEEISFMTVSDDEREGKKNEN